MTPGGLFERVSPGQAVNLRADVWNALMDMARDWHGGQRPHRQAPPVGPERENGREVIVQFTEDVPSDTVLPRFSVVVLGDSIIVPGTDEPTFGARRATEAARFTSVNGSNDALGELFPYFYAGNAPFAVTLEPIAWGYLGRAVVCGVVPAFVSFPTAAHLDAYRYNRAMPSTDFAGRLEAAKNGPFRIIAADRTKTSDGANARICLVELTEWRGLRSVDTYPYPLLSRVQADVTDLQFNASHFFMSAPNGRHTALISLANAGVPGPGPGGGMGAMAEGDDESADATPFVLASFTLEDDAMYLFEFRAVAIQTGGGANGAAYVRSLAVKRTGGGAATAVGAAVTTVEREDAGAAAWDVSFALSGNDVQIVATGPAAPDTVHFAGWLYGWRVN